MELWKRWKLNLKNQLLSYSLRPKLIETASTNWSKQSILAKIDD
jgi:hypothetical protein